MTKKELKERLDRLGLEPINEDGTILDLLAYLAQKVDILADYLLQHKVTPR
jgi:hypothetical protein